MTPEEKGQQDFMRFKLGLGIGFAAGYYLGAKAGRARYEQLQEWVHKARESDVVETAADKAKAVVDLGFERARDLVDSKRRGDAGESATTADDVVLDVRGNGG
ncbi:MAG: hypothetical protein ACRD0U_15920 [Acidimicrobiales bacterium]